MNLQPYEKASEELIRQNNLPKKGLKAAGQFAGAALGSAALSRIAPLLSSFIPEDLAIKGLSKINPTLGKFVKNAINSGSSFDEVKSFIQEKVTPNNQEQENKTEQPKESRNIIEQYSPELYQFISSQVASGRNPIEAAAIAQNDKKFKPIIDKLSKDHKTPWSSIIESIYGNGQSANPQQQSQSFQQPQQGTGQATQALMQALQAAKQARQRRT